MTPDTPPLFYQELARACIDAGAHVFAGHGPHFLQGIELHRRRPIFYNLGNFVVELESIPRHPPEAYRQHELGLEALPAEMIARRTGDETLNLPGDASYWRSVLPVCRWEKGELREVRLYPLDLGYRQPWGARGRPVLAEGELAREVLRDLDRLSRPLGSQVREQNGVGTLVTGT